jgi:TetR/AcrR family transcriptional regulator, cholesterol catabolism regulator
MVGMSATVRPRRTQRERREATIAALLVAARDRFAGDGYAATSLDAIAADAGVTKGALYHHFSGKEEILHQIQEDYIDDRLRNAKAIMEEFDGPVDRLQQLILESLVGIERFRPHVAVFTQERRFLTEVRFAAIKDKRDELDGIYESVIRQGVDEGVFGRDVQPRIAAFGVLGMLGWAYNWYRPHGKLSVTEVANQLSELVLGGLLVRD